MDNKVTKFPVKSRKTSDDGSDRTSIDSARVVAKLGVMNAMDYERTRMQAAKDLGCRVSFLDRLVKRVRESIQGFKASHWKNFHLEPEPVCTNFHENDGTVIPAWRIARSVEKNPLDIASLVLLSDGNFTITHAVPLK